MQRKQFHGHYNGESIQAILRAFGAEDLDLPQDGETLRLTLPKEELPYVTVRMSRRWLFGQRLYYLSMRRNHEQESA